MTQSKRSRLPDWQARLETLVADRLNKPFARGERDCVMWAADVVEAVTGSDPARAFRGAYGTDEQALALYRRLRGLARQCAAALGDEIDPRLAGPGDVGLVLESEGETLVAHVGQWMCQASDGLRPVACSAVVRAWRCLPDG